MSKFHLDMSEPDWVEVLAFASESGAFEFLNDPDEDLYDHLTFTTAEPGQYIEPSPGRNEL